MSEVRGVVTEVRTNCRRRRQSDDPNPLARRGRRNRQRGREGELEVCALLADAGLEPELDYAQPERGGAAGDLNSLAGRFEVRRRRSLPSYLRPADEVRAVLCRQDRGGWLAVVRLGDLLELLKRSGQVTP